MNRESSFAAERLTSHSTEGNGAENDSDGFNYDTIVQEPIGELGRYSLRVLLTTGLGMMVVTATIMAPIVYHKIQPTWNCADLGDGPTKNGNCSCVNRSYYHSSGLHLYAESFVLVCDRGYLLCLTGAFVTVGALVGAFIFGHLADRYGRKPAGIISLGGTLLSSFVFAFSPSYAISCLFVLFVGLFAGGYTVVSVVMVIEFVGRRYRLLVSCFHGWPYGLMYMGLMCFIAKNWRHYHISMAASGLPFLLSWGFLVESPRWLIQMNQLERAGHILDKIASFNGFKMSPVTFGQLEELYQIGTRNGERRDDHTYLDLIRPTLIRKYTFAMMFMWLSSALVSGGIYSTAGNLVGIVYLNVFLIGLTKCVGGVVPLILNIWWGRRPIMLTGIASAAVALWITAIIYIVDDNIKSTLNKIAVGIIMAGAAAMGPTWQMNHLYACELFPTVIRSMAGAACNLGSLTGSALGPQVAYLSTFYRACPYIIFGMLTIAQLWIAFSLLPETKGKALPDCMPLKSDRINQSTESILKPSTTNEESQTTF